MTLQTDQTSPFQNTPNQETGTPEEFSFRTMKDDLAEMQKNESSLSEKISTLPKKDTPLPQIKPAPVTPSQKPANPFIEQVSSQKPFVAPTSSSQKEVAPKASAIVEIPVPAKTPSNSGPLAYKIILTTIIVLIVAILGLGGYYFWMTKTPVPTPALSPAPVTVENIPTQTEPVAEEAPVVITPPTEKYSAEKPNYLTLDLTTLGADDIRKAFADAADALKSSTIQRPYEFIVVDTSNNPVPFQTFATAAKLNFSSKILSSLGADASFFLYNDNGDIRLAFSAPIVKKDVLSAELKLQEKTFVTDVSFLFLDAKPETTTGTFQDGAYKTYKNRFLNLNAQLTLSIDYTVTDSKLVIGTSKNTLRAVLDKQATQTPAVSTTAPAIETAPITIAPTAVSNNTITPIKTTPIPAPVDTKSAPIPPITKTNDNIPPVLP